MLRHTNYSANSLKYPFQLVHTLQADVDVYLSICIMFLCKIFTVALKGLVLQSKNVIRCKIYHFCMLKTFTSELSFCSFFRSLNLRRLCIWFSYADAKLDITNTAQWFPSLPSRALHSHGVMLSFPANEDPTGNICSLIFSLSASQYISRLRAFYSCSVKKIRTTFVPKNSAYSSIGF